MGNKKQLIKNILIGTALVAVLYLIYIFAQYWDIAVEAFKAGWESA